MSITFLNLVILAGLAAVAIPPIIHFLNRRRHDVVDWGAMQFLLANPAQHRRLMIEELLLMALRMGLIALLVLAFAAPIASGPLVAGWTRPPRDTVLLLDASYSMDRHNAASSPWQRAKTWCAEWLKQARAGDRVAIVLAAQPPQAVVPELTSDTQGLPELLDQLPRPSANADWPRAVREAWDLLRDHGRAPRRDVVLLADRQKLGWADAPILARWQELARRLRSERETRKDDAENPAPTLWAVNLGEVPPSSNFSVSSLQTSRTVIGVGQRLRFEATLEWRDVPNRRPPLRLKATISEHSQDLQLPKQLDQDSGRWSATFDHRFTTAGVHLVSVSIETAEGQDAAPADDELHIAIEAVQELPVLLIDGADRIDADSATFFLAKAFADPGDKAKTSFIVPRLVTCKEFDPEAQLSRIAPPPRVVVLADAPRLTELQLAGLTRFVENGGGLLVFVGPRADPAFYRDRFYQDGKGLLPARLEQVENVKSDQAVSLDVKRFLHPALTLFRDEPNCTLGHAGYTRWWKALAPPSARASNEGTSGGTPVAFFGNDDPWLIEKLHGEGRVLLSTLPMDRSWDGHLPRTWEFPVLAHELMFALADARSGGLNLQPGQPLRLQRGPILADGPMSITLFRPDGKATTRAATAWPFVWPNPGPPGVYYVQIGDRPRQPVVIHADASESDLTSCTKEEWNRIAELLSLRDLDDPHQLDEADAATTNEEIWWLFLAGVIGLLCGELWLTRRMALARGGN